jgi:hypothetical protein
MTTLGANLATVAPGLVEIAFLTATMTSVGGRDEGDD